MKPRKPARAPRPTAAALTDAATTLLIRGATAATVTAGLAEKLGATPAEAERALAAGRRAIARAASFDPDEALGQAIKRLNDTYARAYQIDDPATCLAAQRELDKLQNLYAAAAASATRDPGRDPELDAIAAHLLPLQLAAADAPLREHARIAAERLRELPRPAPCA